METVHNVVECVVVQGTHYGAIDEDGYHLLGVIYDNVDERFTGSWSRPERHVGGTHFQSVRFFNVEMRTFVGNQDLDDKAFSQMLIDFIEDFEANGEAEGHFYDSEKDLFVSYYGWKQVPGRHMAVGNSTSVFNR